MATKIHLLVIDPQVDFCDPKGALPVAGADKDMDCLAALIVRLKDKWDDVHVTLDTHHFVDVAHPSFWVDSRGQHPAPFTIISAADVASGRWAPYNPGMQRRMLEYVQSLERNGRYPLCIWPPHCLIGTPGHNVYPSVAKALLEWEKTFANVDYVSKGSNPFTEHYSAVQADVPDPADPSTTLNTRLIQVLQEADVIALAGEALSHCLANTVRDIAANFGEENIRKLVLLSDCASSVGGFEKMGEDFVKEMTGRGMRVSSSVDFMR